MSQDWRSDSDDDDNFEWESDGDGEPSSTPALRNLDAAGPSTLVRQVLTDKKIVSFSTRLGMTCYYNDLNMIFVYELFKGF
jgi:hypothetical protein